MSDSANLSITELESLLAAKRQDEKNAAKAARDAFVPVYAYSVVPVEKSGFTTIWDDSCVWYRLSGIVTNADDARNAGVVPFEGGMDYLYNKATKKVVMRGGGGSIHLSEPRDSYGTYRVSEESYRAVLAQLSAFINESPNGGDVTELVTNYRKSIND